MDQSLTKLLVGIRLVVVAYKCTPAASRQWHIIIKELCYRSRSQLDFMSRGR